MSITSELSAEVFLCVALLEESEVAYVDAFLTKLDIDENRCDMAFLAAFWLKARIRTSRYSFRKPWMSREE